MSVYFGTCSEPVKKVGRACSLGSAVSFAPYGTVDILNPTIIVNSGAVSPSSSVMYISDYGRYYNITATQYDGKKAIVTGLVDVYATYPEVFYTTQFVTRSASPSHYDKNIPIDISLPAKPCLTITPIGNGIGNVTEGSDCYMIGVM